MKQLTYFLLFILVTIFGMTCEKKLPSEEAPLKQVDSLTGEFSFEVPLKWVDNGNISVKIENEIEQNSEELGAVDTIPIENGEENFKAFLEKFGTDDTFQLSRIVYPLKVLEYALDEDGDINVDSITVSIRNLEDQSFLEDIASNPNRIEIYGYEYPTDSDIKAFMPENEYFVGAMVRSVMRIAEDEYFVHIFAMEVCGRHGYHFKKNDSGQWYLVEIDYRSL